MGASKLDNSLDSLAPRTAKESFRDLTAGVLTKDSRKLPSFSNYMAL